MANERIGRIESIEGQATVAHADGSNETLHTHSQVFIDDIVSTGEDTHLSIRLLNGSVIEIGSEQSRKLDSELIDAAAGHAPTLHDGFAIDAISAIGILTRADGDVQVIRDGETITLRVGDPVYTGDVIKTGPAGSAVLTMSDGSSMSLGADFVADLNDAVLTRSYTDYLESGLDEAVQIQAAIQAGRDPSEDAPAPGAGELRGSEGGEAVILQASNRAVTPESGHETHGQELPFRIPDDELALNPTVLPRGVSISDGAPSPATEGTHPGITFTVSLTNAADQAVTVAYTTADGTAQAGSDYTAISGTLTFDPGQTSQTVTVPVLDDAVFEDPEAFSVVISNAQYAAGTADAVVLAITDDTGTGNIVDGDQPGVSISDGAPDPALEGAQPGITFTVSLTNAADQAVTVAYTTADGTAQAGSDYTAVSGTLTFAAGQTSQTLTVPVLDDAVFEDPEAFSVVISNAVYAAGTPDAVALAITDDTGAGNIVDNDVETFPTGLAYTVAGSKVIGGEQLYAVDLETGQTTRIGEVQVNGTSLNPNAIGGMSLNPIDGYLYAVANSGNDSYLIKINPATAETEVIDATNNFAKASAATHGIDGTLYLSFGNQIFIYDTANPGSTSSLTLIAQGAKSLAVDAIAINNTGDVMYLANGDELWSVDVVPGGGIQNPVYIGQVVETIGTSSTAYTLDGMSFDDNGVLWGLDNAGNILRIDATDGSAANVATISNSEVRGGGTDSLAISNVDPGTYVVLSDADTVDSSGLTVQDRSDGYTHYIPSEEVATSTMLDETELDIGSVTAANVSITTGPNNEITVLNLSPSDVDNVYIKADTDKTLAVDGFNSVDVTTRGEQNSNITITGAERGVIDTGEGEDLVTIITDPLVGNGGSDETFVISTDGGDDIVTLSPGSLANSDFEINTGEHMDGSETALDFDILRIDDDIDLGAMNLDISNIEGIDVTGSGNNLVQLSAQDVLDMTDGNKILRVDGDMTDAVQALDSGWVQGTDQMIGAVNYHTFTSSGVSLLVNEDMQLLGGVNIP